VLKTPLLSIVLSEGGSGGALGIAVADWVAMFEHAVYMVCPPERCAEILWRDIEKREHAAEAMKITAADLHALGVIDRILSEGPVGAHHDSTVAIDAVTEEIGWFLAEAGRGRWTLQRRQQRFLRWGAWTETLEAATTEPATDEDQAATVDDLPSGTRRASGL